MTFESLPEAHMENIAFARFSREDLEVTSDDCIIKARWEMR